MAEGNVVIFTDGACSGNPGPGGWAAIVLTPDELVKELGGGVAQTTNNRMELMSCIAALESIADVAAPVELFTDSTYVIGGVTGWVHGWKKNGWSKKDGQPVLNKDLWEHLDRLNGSRRAKGPVDWRYVAGHSGNPGNERCDEIAVAFSKGGKPALFAGPVREYGHDLGVKPAPPSPKAKGDRKTARSGTKGVPVYLSLVGGQLERHPTWAACSARVKGVPNARYRKASGPSEEAAILKEWGLARG